MGCRLQKLRDYNGVIVRQVVRYRRLLFSFWLLENVVRWLEFNVVCYVSDRLMTFTIMT